MIKQITISILMMFFIICTGCAAQETAGSHANTGEITTPGNGAATPEYTATDNKYSWLADYHIADAAANRIAVPRGYVRVKTEPGSFADWLRFLPLKPGKPTVRLYDGEEINITNIHVAVLDIDTGTKDLQQCADAVIRLRAEYLYSRRRFGDIMFHFTSGHLYKYTDFTGGKRPVVAGSKVTFAPIGRKDPAHTYSKFREDYLNKVFSYASTASLEKELVPVDDPAEIMIGDVFVEPRGSSYLGHAMIVIDVAENPETGKRVFMLAQSYTPARDIHILANPNNMSISPWYEADFGDTLLTPQWRFNAKNLRRFPPE